jgi:FHS family glucose/mannose:H+ symporter-like MFS transporter
MPSSSPSPAGAALLAGPARKGLAGFFLSGLLFSFLGVIAPAWQHHITGDFAMVGNYFLVMNLGILAAPAASRLGRLKSLSVVLVLACSLACAALIYLAVLPPGIDAWWRTPGIFLLGCGAGLLNMGVFRAITPLYRHDAVATINLAGAMFGVGCVAMTILVAGTFYVYNVTSILIFAALLPALFLVMYATTRFPSEEPVQQPSWKQAFLDFRSLAAVLFTLLLFFQFGNEWAVAGWLPLFLIQRLGISPESSLVMLAVYWIALLVGRVAVFSLLPSISRGKLLMGTVLAALFGCIILLSTNNRFGAVMGILFVGGGFSSIYPLVVQKIGGRFPYYHPGFFNGIFSFALTGGLLAPWSLGLFTSMWGIHVVMILPLFGTIMVFLLLVLIWAEAKFGGA